MSKKDFKAFTWKDIVLSCIYSPLMVFQFVLFFFSYQNYMGINLLLYIGLVLWILSVIFGIMPMYTFKKKGGVPRGKTYIHTKKLVDTGVYSVVRHPQYLAGLLLIFALMCMTQHWMSIVAGTVALIAFYVDTLRADPPLIEKFGDEYVAYMRRVPRLNFLKGLWNLNRRRKLDDIKKRG